MTPEDTEARALVAQAARTGRWFDIIDRLQALRSIMQREERTVRARVGDIRQVYASEVSKDGRYRGPLRCPQIVLTKRKAGRSIRASF